MSELSENKVGSGHMEYELRNYQIEDFDKIWKMWQTIFPKWPIERLRMENLLNSEVLAGEHYIHENGFCLAYLSDGEYGKVAAVGVLPDYRGKGLGTALLNKGMEGLRNAAIATGQGELKSLEIGSRTPRFWPQMPVDFPPEVRDFFIHRGFQGSSEPPTRDLYKGISNGDIVPPEILNRVSKMDIKFSPWSPELYEECMTKQRANFGWFKAYEALAVYNQHHQVMVAFDPITNAQIGWTLMCYDSIMNDTFAFLPLLPSKDRTGLIAAVGVDKSARGKGVGLALVVKAMENMKKRGAEGVLIDWVAIQGFYERLGFETFWEYQRLVWPDDK